MRLLPPLPIAIGIVVAMTVTDWYREMGDNGAEGAVVPLFSLPHHDIVIATTIPMAIGRGGSNLQ